MRMRLTDEVRAGAAAIAERARSVRIVGVAAIEPGAASAPALDRTLHFLDGDAEDVARYFLTLDAINFGSGWFPTLRKRPGHSGYATVAASLTGHFRTAGPWTNAQLRTIDTPTIAGVLDQQAGHELMSLYAQALRDLGAALGNHNALDWIAAAEGSAEAPGPASRPRHAVVPGSPVLQARADYSPPTWRSPAWRSSTTSTA